MARSTPSSCAIFRTSGVARTPPLGRGVQERPGLPYGWAAGLQGRFVLADHHQHGPDRDDLALGDEDPRDLPGGGRRNLDRRLVGLHLDERVVLGDLLALGDEPAGDLALGQALTEVGELELVGHR